MNKHPFIQKWLPRDHALAYQNHPDTETKNPTSFNNSNRVNDVEYMIDQIEKYQLDLTAGYENWLDLGFCFADEFKEAGRSYFHRVSKFHPKYDPKESDLQYDRCLRGKRSGKTIRSFFFVAREAGIELPGKK